MTVYIVYEDCGCDETRNVACLETEEKAKRFCYKRNTSRPTDSIMRNGKSAKFLKEYNTN